MKFRKTIGFIACSTLALSLFACNKKKTTTEKGTTASKQTTASNATTAHVHSYEEKAVDKALAKAANCENAASYYKSCSCGELSSETFTSGNPLGHNTSVTGVCQREDCKKDLSLLVQDQHDASKYTKITLVDGKAYLHIKPYGCDCSSLYVRYQGNGDIIPNVKIYSASDLTKEVEFIGSEDGDPTNEVISSMNHYDEDTYYVLDFGSLKEVEIGIWINNEKEHEIAGHEIDGKDFYTWCCKCDKLVDKIEVKEVDADSFKIDLKEDDFMVYKVNVEKGSTLSSSFAGDKYWLSPYTLFNNEFVYGNCYVYEGEMYFVVQAIEDVNDTFTFNEIPTINDGDSVTFASGEREKLVKIKKPTDGKNYSILDNENAAFSMYDSAWNPYVYRTDEVDGEYVYVRIFLRYTAETDTITVKFEQHYHTFTDGKCSCGKEYINMSYSCEKYINKGETWLKITKRGCVDYTITAPNATDKITLFAGESMTTKSGSMSFAIDEEEYVLVKIESSTNKGILKVKFNWEE